MRLFHSSTKAKSSAPALEVMDTLSNSDTEAMDVKAPSKTTTVRTMETYLPTTEAVQRPRLATRVPSVQTRYMEMLLHLDHIPSLHNILASVFTWVLLAGFLVVPGTFTSFKDSETFKSASEDDRNKVEATILHSVAHIGLLWLSVACCVIGGLGMCWLWFRWRQNYVWLINRIFLPGMLNSIAGLLTTIVNVLTAQKGVFSITAKITAIFTGAATGVLASLFILYNNWVLQKVKDTHDREIGDDYALGMPMEKVKRTGHEPA